jgi:hypothetical protein
MEKKPFSNPELVEYLKGLKINPQTSSEGFAQAANAPLDGMIQKFSIHPESEDGKMLAKVRRDLYAAAYSGGEYRYPRGVGAHTSDDDEALVSAMAEVQAFQNITIDNLVRPKLTALSTGLFEQRTLAENEVPKFENKTGHAVLVHAVSQDGRARKGNIIKSNGHQTFDIDLLTTEDVGYKLRDILKGSVEEEMRALVDLSDDLAQKMEAILWGQLNSTDIFKAFNFDNAKAHLRTMNFHPTHAAAIISNIPSTNLIEMTSAGGPTKAVVVALVQHFRKFGSLPVGKPNAIFYPSGYDLKCLEEIATTTASGPYSDQIVQQGTVGNVAGDNLAFKPIVTMSKSLKRVICGTSQPVGMLFRKPSEDRVFSDRDERNNRGSMFSQQAYKLIFPEQWRARVAAVKVEADA